MKIVRARASILLALSVTSFLVALPAAAATLVWGETYALPSSGRVEHNLYAAAGTVLISGPVLGDVAAAGGHAALSGPISRDVLAAAGTVEILGAVGENVRAAGGQITLSNTIGGDAALAGGSLSLLSGSAVSGDALLAGGNVNILGNISGDVHVAGRAVFIDGKILGSVHIYSMGKVHLGPHAIIGGDLIYHSPEPAQLDTGAVVKGKTEYTYLAPVLSAHDVHGFFAGLFGVLFITKFLVLIAAALLFVLVFRRVSISIVQIAFDGFWKRLALGLAVFVAVPFASLIVALTVFGSLIAVIAMICWLLLVLISQVYAGVLLAGVVRKYLLRKPLPPVVLWQDAVLGMLGLSVIFLVPQLGLLIYCIFFLCAFGSLSYLSYRHFLLSR